MTVRLFPSIQDARSGFNLTIRPQNYLPHWFDTTVPDADYYATLAFFYFELLSCCEPTRVPLNHVKILLAT